MRPRKPQSRIYLEATPTIELLRLHERAFGPLDPVGKRRMVDTARTHGWDRTWDTDTEPLAA